MRITNSNTPPRRDSLGNKSKQRGFTIIEVALVLAIAGLIFLVVFLALPALQNSQKDTARKQDVGRVVSALQQYEADGGDLSDLTPSNADKWYPTNGSASSGFAAYVGKLGSEVAGVTVSSATKDVNYESVGGNIRVYPSHRCDNSSASPSDVAVTVGLSSGKYCVEM